MTKKKGVNLRKFQVTNGTVSGKEDKLSRYKKIFRNLSPGILFPLVKHFRWKVRFSEIPHFFQLS